MCIRDRVEVTPTFERMEVTVVWLNDQASGEHSSLGS